jgi:CrcB protein
MEWILVAVGGALGAVSRHWLSGWVSDLTGGAFPWGTLAVNVLGSFLLGVLVVWLEYMVDSGPARALLAFGVLGAFTTFSTFSYEAAALIQNGEWTRAMGYMGGSLAMGLAGVFLGFAAGSLLLTPKA